jgi:hypothetical protein
LVNTIYNFLKETLEGIMGQQPSSNLQYFCALGYQGP